MWHKAESMIRPEVVEYGKTVVYIRKNITEEQREEGTVYVYDEITIDKEYYPLYAQQQADIDYLAIMTEVDL